MPELPEVETVRRGLAATVVGAPITDVEVHHPRTVRRTSAGALTDGLRGTTITAFARRGKYLLGELASGARLMVHLRMSGRLLVVDAGAPRPAHTHVVVHLGDDRARELWFVDPRTFGEVVVYDPHDEADIIPELGRLGVDPVTDGLEPGELAHLLEGRRRALKALLLDQATIAGIGNIYADEICHVAGIDPRRRADTLGARRVARLHDAIHDVLDAAIASGGSTLRDRQYMGADGRGGWFQLQHRVYDRAGLECRTCGRAVVRRTVITGRSAYFCPRCQR